VPAALDVEVLGVVRRDHLRGRLDRTAAAQAVEDLEALDAVLVTSDRRLAGRQER